MFFLMKVLLFCLIAERHKSVSWHVFLDKVRGLASIHEAVRCGDVTEVQAMVQSGAGINDLDPKFKFTPLHWACNYGSLEVLWLTAQLLNIIILMQESIWKFFGIYFEINCIW